MTYSFVEAEAETDAGNSRLGTSAFLLFCSSLCIWSLSFAGRWPCRITTGFMNTQLNHSTIPRTGGKAIYQIYSVMEFTV